MRICHICIIELTAEAICDMLGEYSRYKWGCLYRFSHLGIKLISKRINNKVTAAIAIVIYINHLVMRSSNIPTIFNVKNVSQCVKQFYILFVYKDFSLFLFFNTMF